jgi:hypothetical protein
MAELSKTTVATNVVTPAKIEKREDKLPLERAARSERPQIAEGFFEDGYGREVQGAAKYATRLCAILGKSSFRYSEKRSNSCE